VKKSVLITGCSSGFGKAMVPLFLSQGWQVIASMRRLQERTNIFSKEREKFGEDLKLVSLDVTSSHERQTVRELIQQNFDTHLDCLVNNAGFGVMGALEDLSEEQLRKQMEVNFFGSAFLIQDLLPSLRQSQGRVICISSVLGILGMPLNSAYCASKFAIEGLMEALYYELKPHSVQVCLVEPGGYRTNFLQNSSWAENSSSEDSIYETEVRNLQDYQRKRLSRKPRQSLDDVAKKVVSLADQKSLPLRIRMGTDAQSAYWIKCLLPAGVQQKMMGKAYRRIMGDL